MLKVDKLLRMQLNIIVNMAHGLHSFNFYTVIDTYAYAFLCFSHCVQGFIYILKFRKRVKWYTTY